MQEVGILDGAVLATGVGVAFALSRTTSDPGTNGADEEPPIVRKDPNELRAFDGLRSRSDGPQMMADSRSRRLNKQAYNRRNMSIDERVAFDQLMAKREADAKVRNAVLASFVLVAAVYLLTQS